MSDLLHAGLGFKPAFAEAALAARGEGLWFEVHAENYLVDGGPRLAMLEALRAVHPLSLHGVSASLGGAAPPDVQHLRQLAALVERTAPALVSEHLAWNRLGPQWAPDLLPLPRTTEALHRLAANVSRLQESLRRRVAIENPSHYLPLGHDWGEVDFLHELVRRTGCGLLVDVNNVFVSAHNVGQPAQAWLDAIEGDAVMEVHLAGHRPDADPAVDLLIDSHDTPVAAAVWALYERLVARIGARPTLIERDDALPPFDDLMAECMRARAVLEAVPEALA